MMKGKRAEACPAKDEWSAMLRTAREVVPPQPSSSPTFLRRPPGGFAEVFWLDKGFRLPVFSL